MLSKFKIIFTLFFSFFGKKLKTIPDNELLDYLVNSKKSLIRWGDGETSVANGKDIYFQPAQEQLKIELNKIVEKYDNSSPYILAIPIEFLKSNYLKMKKRDSLMWSATRLYFKSRIKKEMHYANSLYFRNCIVDGIQPHIICDKLSTEYKNVIVVCGNNLESKLLIHKSVFFIKVSDIDAFSSIVDIVKQIDDKISLYELKKTDTCLMVSCGPTAKIICSLYSKRGFQSFDLGFLLNSKAIESKYYGR